MQKGIFFQFLPLLVLRDVHSFTTHGWIALFILSMSFVWPKEENNVFVHHECGCTCWRYSEKKKQQQQWHKQYTLKSTINVFSPRTFSLIRYGYCYYRGELPIRWHFMTRDFLKLSFEAYWWNESNFVVRQEVITVYQINTPDISINVKEKKNKETLTHR